MQRSPLIFSGLLSLSGALHGAQAAELGDATVRSWLGQPMVADIELLPDEGGAVQAAIARPDVYRGANVAMPAVLASTHMSVMRRDGKQFLHVTSLKPVDSSHVHLFLELVEGGKHTVREVTLWFQPDPHPPAAAPASQPAVVPAAVNAAAAGLAPAATAVPSAARPATGPRALAAGAAAAPAPGAPAPHGAAAAPGATAHGAPAAPASGTAAAARSGGDASAQRRAATAAESAEHARACAALDYTNAQLSAQIVDLEEKVKLLQATMGGHPVAAAKPQVVPRLQAPLKPAPAKDAAKSHSTNWLLYGGAAAVLALLAGVAAVLIRKRKGKGSATQGKAAKKNALADMVAKLKRERTAPVPAAEPAEPVLEPDTVEN